jgi:hypothetical protein
VTAGTQQLSTDQKSWRAWVRFIGLPVGFFLPALLLFLVTIDGAGFPGFGLAGPLVLLTVLLIALSALGLLTVCSVWALGLTRRRFPMAWALFGCGMLLGTLPALGVPAAAKPLAARIVAIKAQTVIDAVEAFQAEHGALPNSLEQLVPNYLPGPVQTGSPAYPEIRFSRGADSSGGWTLEVPMTELMGFDALWYCPAKFCSDLDIEEEGEIVATTRTGRWWFVVD